MENFAKLLWRCRRGTLELDVLLQNYLKNGYCNADASEQAQFQDFIALEDDRLIAYLLNAQCPPEDTFWNLVQHIKSCQSLSDAQNA